MAGQTPARAASFQDIYNFIGGSGDGQEPESGLAVDDLGRLVGTTPSGGPFDLGVVYRLTPPGYAGAPWTEQVLYGFASAGYPTTDPIAPVIVQGASTIFGTAANGGKGDAGFVYRLDNSGTQWVLSVLHSFTGGIDGSDPCAGCHNRSLGPALRTEPPEAELTTRGDALLCLAHRRLPRRSGPPRSQAGLPVPHARSILPVA